MITTQPTGAKMTDALWHADLLMMWKSEVKCTSQVGCLAYFQQSYWSTRPTHSDHYFCTSVRPNSKKNKTKWKQYSQLWVWPSGSLITPVLCILPSISQFFAKKGSSYIWYAMYETTMLLSSNVWPSLWVHLKKVFIILVDYYMWQGFFFHSGKNTMGKIIITLRSSAG